VGYACGHFGRCYDGFSQRTEGIMMNRRSFLTACLATLSAPAIVRASSLMPLSVRLPILWGDGLHDDTEAFHRLLVREKIQSQKNVFWRDNTLYIPAGTYLVNSAIDSHLKGDGRKTEIKISGDPTTNSLPFLQPKSKIEKAFIDLYPQNASPKNYWWPT